MTGSVGAEMERLAAFCRELTDAIDEFEHEMRRCTEALERAGGRSRQHELRLNTLRTNRDAYLKDLAKAKKELAEARKGKGAGGPSGRS